MISHSIIDAVNWQVIVTLSVLVAKISKFISLQAELQHNMGNLVSTKYVILK